jgi:hypothetical protein
MRIIHASPSAARVCTAHRRSLTGRTATSPASSLDRPDRLHPRGTVGARLARSRRSNPGYNITDIRSSRHTDRQSLGECPVLYSRSAARKAVGDVIQRAEEARSLRVPLLLIYLPVPRSAVSVAPGRDGEATDNLTIEEHTTFRCGLRRS